MNDYGNPRMNELAAWMKFYDDQGMGGNLRNARDMSGGNPFDVAGMKADWAAEMMRQGGQGGQGGQAPNFFASGGGGGEERFQQPAYVRPQRTDLGPPPQMAQRDPRIMNYLAQMLQPAQKQGYSTSIGGRL